MELTFIGYVLLYIFLRRKIKFYFPECWKTEFKINIGVLRLIFLVAPMLFGAPEILPLGLLVIEGSILMMFEYDEIKSTGLPNPPGRNAAWFYFCLIPYKHTYNTITPWLYNTVKHEKSTRYPRKYWPQWQRK